MLGVGGVFGGAGMLMPTLELRRSDSTALTVLKVVLAVVFLVALWYIAFEPLYSGLFPDEPARVLR